MARGSETRPESAPLRCRARGEARAPWRRNGASARFVEPGKLRHFRKYQLAGVRDGSVVLRPCYLRHVDLESEPFEEAEADLTEESRASWYTPDTAWYPMRHGALLRASLTIRDQSVLRGVGKRERSSV